MKDWFVSSATYAISSGSGFKLNGVYPPIILPPSVLHNTTTSVYYPASSKYSFMSKPFLLPLINIFISLISLLNIPNSRSTSTSSDTIDENTLK